MHYINRKGNGYRETVDQFERYREAREMVREYRMSDPGAEYYVSQRACASWHADEAIQILASCGVRRDGDHYPDFHTLNSATVEALLERADREKYRKPSGANGSRGRYYYARLVRRAESY